MREHLTTRAPDGRGVTLRLLKPEDAPRVQEACSDPETVRWLGSDIINERYSLDHARSFIERALGPTVRGAGITTAAAVAVVDEALTPAVDGGAGLRRRTLRAAVGNVGSQRVAEGAGFVRTGRTRQSDPLIDGTFTDEFTYDVLATDPR